MERKRLRLEYIDGLRGLAALYILLHHAVALLPARSVHRSLTEYTHWLEQGPAAVPIFIVLSGFCLMIPVAMKGRLDGGFWPYIARRARRILPAYYACLALTLALIAAIPLLSESSDPRWQVALPAFDLKTAIIPHLFLYHNWQAAWAYKIDPPMWSVAAEWQIYFLFPALIAVWRRWGVTALLAAGMSFPIVLRFLMITRTWRLLSPWYVGLFALGMAAAVYVFAPKREAPWADRTPWFTVAVASVFLTFMGWDFILRDTLTGIATVTLLVICAKHAISPNHTNRPIIVELLESRHLTALGTFSYSIYLLHYPLLAVANGWLVSWGMGASARMLSLLLVASPLAVLLSYGFHLVCERPFMTTGKRTIHGKTTTVGLIAPAV